MHKHCLPWDVLPVTQESPCVSPMGCRASAALHAVLTGIDRKHWQASALPVEGCAWNFQVPRNNNVTLGIVLQVYNRLQTMGTVLPAAGQLDGSYLTGFSSAGLQ